MFSSIQFVATAVCAGRATLHPLPTAVFETGCSRLTDGVASSIATDGFPDLQAKKAAPLLWDAKHSKLLMCPNVDLSIENRRYGKFGCTRQLVT